MLLFSHNIAKRQGIPVDDKKLAFWTDRWILTDGLVHSRKSDGRKDAGGMVGAPLTMFYRDLTRDTDKTRAGKLVELMKIAGKDWQRKDGSWDISVRLDYTPWIALALKSYAKSSMKMDAKTRTEIDDRWKRTEQWIKKHAPKSPEKTEELAAWLIYEHERGNKVRRAELLAELRKRRRKDGMWGITSDAEDGHLLITGYALFALTSVGLDTSDSMVVETQRLLLLKQKVDGHWEEGGRIFDDGSDTDNVVYHTQATAVISAALSQTIKLPPGTKPVFTPPAKQLAAVNALAKKAAKGYKGITKDSNAELDAPD